MIIALFLNILVLVIGVIFSWLPTIEALPALLGYDLDGALVTGMGYAQTFFTTFWPLTILFQAFIILMLYYIIKITLRFFLGHRAPAHGGQ